MDEEMLEDYFSGLDNEHTALSVCKNKNQLGAPLRKIPQTDKLFSERVRLLSKMLRESKKEATGARKIHLQTSLENAVIQSTGERFHKATSSYMKTELCKKTRTELCRKQERCN